MPGTPRSLTAPSPFAGICMHVATKRAAAESAFFSLLAPKGQGGWAGWWIRQREQVDPSYLVAVGVVFVEVLTAGWHQCYSVWVAICMYQCVYVGV